MKIKTTKKDKHLVSIVIPFYNNERTAEKVIKTVLNQNYKNKEIILVNDYSSDDTLKKIEKYKSKKNIRIINNKKNLGLVKSLNNGIKNSKGEFVVTLLGDCYPESNNWLTLLLEPFKDKNVIATTPLVKYPKELWEKFDNFAKELTKENVGIKLSGLNQKGVAYRKEVLVKVGLFNEKIFKNFGEDFDMIVKLKPYGKVYYGTNGIIIHYHPLDRKELIKKTISYGKSFGLLFRVHGFKLRGWKLKGGLFRVLFPFWAIAKYFKSHRQSRSLEIFIFLLKKNFIYTINFIKGFITRK